MDQEIADNLACIEEQIAAAARRSGRTRSDVTLVAVSKTMPVATIEAALRAGQRVFGENYVQSAERSFHDLRSRYPGVQLHMIGALQSNKAREAVALFDVIETVNRLKLVRELAKEAVRAGKRQRVLLQVNISGEESKSGCRPEEIKELAQAAAACPALDLQGLMAIGTWHEPGTADAVVRAEFIQLRELRDSVAASLGLALPHLSMGMSGDFKEAIEEGATIVRIGSAIFGERG